MGEKNLYIIEKISCPFCDNISLIKMTKRQRDLVCNYGYSINEVFPDKSAAYRETLISGLCLYCQEKFFDKD